MSDLLTEEQRALIEICWEILEEGNMSKRDFEDKFIEKVYGKIDN